jgi:hypothetical protein
LLIGRSLSHFISGTSKYEWDTTDPKLTVPARPHGGSERHERHGSTVVAAVAAAAVVVATVITVPPRQDGVSHPVARNQDDES